VPFEQITSNTILGLVSFKFSLTNVKASIVIGLASLEIVFPSLAISYSFFPLTLIAEVMGGTCLMLPVNFENAVRISCSLSGGTFLISRTLPKVSPLSVAQPSSISHLYVFGNSKTYSLNLVALPTAIIKHPHAPGSNVPVCPIFFWSRFFLSQCTTSWEVIPGGFNTFMKPSI